MRIGTLRHRLTVQQQTEKDDFDTGNVPAWSTINTVFGSIRPKNSAERSQGDKLQRVATHEITIRWRSTISEQNRLIHNTRIFHIAGVRDLDTRQRFLIVDAIDTGESE